MRNHRYRVRRALVVLALLIRWQTSSAGAGGAVQEQFRWRNNDGGETNATWCGNAGAALPDAGRSVPLRLRFAVANTSLYYSCQVTPLLEYGRSSNGPWAAAGLMRDGGDAFEMSPAQYVANGSCASPLLTASGSAVTGRCVSWPSNTCSPVTLGPLSHADFEYTFAASARANAGAQYWFRLSNNGAPLSAYSAMPDLTMTNIEACEAVRISGSMVATGALSSDLSWSFRMSGTEPLAASLSGLPAGITFDGNGSLTGRPAACGVYPIGISASNLWGSDFRTLMLTVRSNFPPAAADSVASAVAGSTIVCPLNITHADQGQTLTRRLVVKPQHGGAEVSGQYVYYTAVSSFAGTDSFSWVSSDGIEDSNTGTVTVAVSGLVPSVADQIAIAVSNRALVITPKCSGGGGYSCIYTVIRAPYSGAVNVAGPRFVYTPASGFTGEDSFAWRVSFSNAACAVSNSITATCTVKVSGDSSRADWRQWRNNEHRTAESTAVLPEELTLCWRKDVQPVPVTYPSYPSLDNMRPVQIGKVLLLPLAANDRLEAVDTDTGSVRWSYQMHGAVRRPPAAAALSNGTNAVLIASDDGLVHCLNADTGALLWKFTAAPNGKKAMGFGRLGSAWPVMASPVEHNGRAFFAAGFFPSWGIYFYCVDIATGRLVWRNDGRFTGDGKISVVGPVTVSGDGRSLYGCSGRHEPWVVDIASGELTGNLAGFGGNKGSTGFYVNADGVGQADAAEPLSIVAGGRTFTASTAAELGVAGTVGSLLAGDSKLFVVTTQGSVYCFGGSNAEPRIHLPVVTPLQPVNDAWTAVVRDMLSRDDLKNGLALVWGCGSGRLVEELVTQAPGLSVVVTDTNETRLLEIRSRMEAAGINAARVSTIAGNPAESGFAPYQAALIASEDICSSGFTVEGGGSNGVSFAGLLYDCLRPFGGEVWLPMTVGQRDAFLSHLSAANLQLVTNRWLAGHAGGGFDGFLNLQRTGLAAGKLQLRPPFRLIAFGEKFFPGALNLNAAFSIQKGVKDGRDIYSWLPAPAIPPGYEPAAPVAGQPATTILNTLYDRIEPVPSIESMLSACGGQPALNYGNTATVAGKLMSLHDRVSYAGAWFPAESWGCPSVDPVWSLGCGAASIRVSNWCSCNERGMYRAQCTFVPDESEEAWLNFRRVRSTALVEDEAVKRVGINFGAPGDRYVESEKMLWSHHPAAGAWKEADPIIPVRYKGPARRVYHHSAQMIRGAGRSRAWVSASQVAGMDGMTIPLVQPVVSRRTPVQPVLDGQTNETCWASGEAVWFGTDCAGGRYVEACHDGARLFVALGLERDHQGDKYARVILRNRENSTSVVLFVSPSGRTSAGITADAWDSAVLAPSGSNAFSAELSIPWSALETAGLWKEQLIMSVEVCGRYLLFDNYDYIGGSRNIFVPLMLDAVRGPAAVARPHTVRLYFAEMEDKAAGERVFDVALQGTTVASGLDIASEAGGGRTELVKVFTNVQVAGCLDIDFNRRSGEPVLSGVEIECEQNIISNILPVAVISASAVTGMVPMDVYLSARESYDGDGQITECAWETGDGRLATGSRLRHVFTEHGTYNVNLLVKDNRGGTGKTNMVITVAPGLPAAFVCSIKASGGDFSSLTAWNGAVASDLTAADSLLFRLTGTGTYSGAADDGSAVLFPGGGTGVLKHINLDGIAYITSCYRPSPGEITVVKSGHTFQIGDAGSRIWCAVAEGCNDWPDGLQDSVTMGGWNTDALHAPCIRAAPGKGHSGRLREANGRFSGFGLNSAWQVDGALNLCANARVERITACQLNLAGGVSVNRTIVSGSVYRYPGQATGAVMANTVAGGDLWGELYGARLYNCTLKSLPSGMCSITAVNTVLFGSGSAKAIDPAAWLFSRCVSSDAAAGALDGWKDGREGNLTNRVVSFRNAAGGDFHLVDSDTGARTCGSYGLGADLEGQDRLWAYQDAGADQTCPPDARPLLCGPLSISAWLGNRFRHEIRFSGAGSTGVTISGLPEGLTFDGTNLIQGVPVSTGQYEVVAVLTNPAGASTNAMLLNVRASGKAPWFTAAPQIAQQDLTARLACLSVRGSDDDGEAGLSYTWSVLSPSGARVVFSTNGCNAAGNTTASFSAAGAYTLEVTVRNLYGISARTGLSFRILQELAELSVTPAAASVRAGEVCQFTGTALDQFANPMSESVLSWSVSGGGSIDAGGIFSAGITTGGPYCVLAGFSGLVATASVHVTTEYCMPLSLSGYSNRTDTLQDFPVLIILSNGMRGGFSFDATPFNSPSGTDLRITTNVNTGGCLDYEISQWDTGRACRIWVRVPEIRPDGSTRLYLNWGGDSSRLACTTNGAVWRNGFAGVWHDGGRLDSTSNRNNGAVAGGLHAGAVDALLGSASDFDGVDDVITISNAPCLNLTTQLTLSAWIKPDSLIAGDYSPVLQKQSAEYVNQDSFFLGVNSLSRLHFGSYGGNIQSTVNSGWLGGWRSIGATYRKSDAGMYQGKVFINGVADQPAVSTLDEMAGGVNSIKVGWMMSGASERFYDGLLAEIRLSSVIRSDDWIWAEYLTVAHPEVFVTAGAAVVLPAGNPFESLPDLWKIRYFGAVSAPGSGAMDDPDCDGACNLAEWKAGTDPMDAGSSLRVSRCDFFRTSGEDCSLVLRWTGTAGRLYGVDYSTNLSDGFVFRLYSNILGAAGVNSVTTHLDGVEGYLRIVVE